LASRGWWEFGEQDGGDDEEEAVEEVADYEGPAAAELVDEDHAEELGEEGYDGVICLVF